MIILILILGFIVRLINLDQSLWLDEASQVIQSSKSIHYIFLERLGDFHPPLSYLIYHFWLMLGQTEIWLRFLPTIFGVLTIFIIYKLSKALFNERIAILSALLLALAPYHIYYSQEIRMYSMATFFASLSIYYIVINRKVGYVIATLALIYTHYMGIFLILAQVIYFFTKRKKEFVSFAKLLLVIFLLYLPWIPQFYQQLIGGIKADQYLPGWGKLLSLSEIKAIPLTFLKFSIGRIDFKDHIVYGTITIVIFVVFGYLLWKSIKIKGTELLILWLFIPIALTWLISFIVPMFQPFRLLFIIPAFYILLALGINQLGKFWKIGLVLSLIISLSGLLVYYTNQKFWREDWREAVSVIKECKDCAALFVWSQPFDPYIWYGGKNGFGLIKKFPASAEEINQNLINLQNRQVYLFEYLQDLSDPQRTTQQELIKGGYKLKETQDFKGVGFIYLYQR